MDYILGAPCSQLRHERKHASAHHQIHDGAHLARARARAARWPLGRGSDDLQLRVHSAHATTPFGLPLAFTRIRRFGEEEDKEGDSLQVVVSPKSLVAGIQVRMRLRFLPSACLIALRGPL